MIQAYSQKIFNGQKPVFDGRRNLYSRDALPIGRDKVCNQCILQRTNIADTFIKKWPNCISNHAQLSLQKELILLIVKAKLLCSFEHPVCVVLILGWSWFCAGEICLQWKACLSSGGAGGDTTRWRAWPGVQSGHQVGSPGQSVRPGGSVGGPQSADAVWRYSGTGCGDETSTQYEVSVVWVLCEITFF